MEKIVVGRAGLYSQFALLFALTFSSLPAMSAPFVSDDFHSQNLDTQVWSFVNPLSDAGLRMEPIGSDSALSLSVPAGVTHTLWTQGLTAPRIMQTTDDADFEIEAKFLSEPTARFQIQGLIVQQDSGELIRFDFYHNNSTLRIFSATFASGTTIVHDIDIAPAAGAPLYMRVTRVEDDWTQSYSYDGATWITTPTFTYALSVGEVGAFVANVGTNAVNQPAFTAEIDYFFNTASPINPEDNGALPPDATPPLLHNIEVGAISDTEVQVSWSTDKPTTGIVDYGLNTSYGSSVTDPVFAYDHSVVVDGLMPSTNYHFRISAEDLVVPPNTSVSGDFIAFTSEAPFIDVWYGDQQKFGNVGETQLWVNVLGNVSDPDGVASLTYTVNGVPGNGVTGPDLTVGPDNKRLQNTGDFNVEIAFSDLLVGNNTVEITATDNLSNEAIKTVTIDYPGGNVWPSDYTIDWSTVTDIQDVSQVVDGLWAIENGAVRPVELGYDRLLAIGDQFQWDNYEVTVPLTLHGFQPNCPCQPAVGVLVRWPGHYDWTSTQPRWGWYPMGGLGWYRLFTGGPGKQLIRGSNGTGAGAAIPTTLALETLYTFKIRAETLPAPVDVHRYSFKLWETSQPEPGPWDAEFDEVLTEISSGSLLLLAHYTDVSFGNVTVTSLGGPPSTQF